MAKGREINMNLPSADDLFTTQEEREQKNQEYVKIFLFMKLQISRIIRLR